MGYAVPLGSHIRRMNPRDTGANINRRRMIRRGATYGPPLPEGAPEDGKERGIAAFVICASLVRQFEFAQNVWVNDRNFHELGNERDPIIGTSGRHAGIQDSEASNPQEDHGAAGFHDGERRRVFLPARPQGAAIPGDARQTSESGEDIRHDKHSRRAHIQPEPRTAPIHRGQAPLQHLLDLELPMGSQSGCDRNG